MQSFLTRGRIESKKRDLKKELDDGPRTIASSATGTYILTKDEKASGRNLFADSPQSKSIRRVRAGSEHKIIDPETAAAYEKVSSWIGEGDDGVLVQEETQEDDLIELSEEEEGEEEKKASADEVVDITPPQAKRRKIKSSVGESTIDLDDLGDEDEFLAEQFESREEEEEELMDTARATVIDLDDSEEENMAIELEIDHSQKDNREDTLDSRLMDEFFVRATSAPNTPTVLAKKRKVTVPLKTQAKPSDVITLDDSEDEKVIKSSQPMKLVPQPKPTRVDQAETPKHRPLRLMKDLDQIEDVGVASSNAIEEVENLEGSRSAELLAIEEPKQHSPIPSSSPQTESIPPPTRQPPSPVPSDVQLYPSIESSTAPIPPLPSPPAPQSQPVPRHVISGARVDCPTPVVQATLNISRDQDLLEDLRQNAEPAIDESTLWPPQEVEAIERELQLEQSALVEAKRQESAKAQHVTDDMVIECQVRLPILLVFASSWLTAWLV